MRKLHYGTAWYPELWDEATIQEDIEHMLKIGINCVRLGEFAWSKIEPKENEFNFSFFINIINKMAEKNIDVIFCTPTAAPPIWMTHQHSERLHTLDNGIKLSHGSRQHVCLNNPYFIARSNKIADELGKNIAGLSNVVAWQLDNEFKCHVGTCMCDSCKQEWHKWLENTYKTIENLNNAWNTGVWSQTYQSFEQVVQPVLTPFLHSPSLVYAYRRFTDDSIAQYCNTQAAILRKYTNKPITTNGGTDFPCDYEKIFNNLDFASFDDYPADTDYRQLIYKYDWMRSIKNKGFYFMETSPSHNGCSVGVEKPHNNGFLTAEVLSTFAAGGKGFLYWLWRQQRSGCEMVHGSILSAWGDKSLGYDNVVNAKKELDKFTPILENSSPLKPSLAVTYSESARAMLDIEPISNYKYFSLTEAFHKIILDRGIQKDFINECKNPIGYKLIITPFCPALKDETIKRYLEYVKNGGTWIVGPMTGYRTPEFTVHTQSGLGRLSELAEIQVEHHYPISKIETIGEFHGLKCRLGGYSTFFTSIGASILGVVKEGLSSNKGFLSETNIGKGKLFILGANPEGKNAGKMWESILRYACPEVFFKQPVKAEEGTAVFPRITAKGEIIYIIINMNGQKSFIQLARPCTDLVENHTYSDKIELKPYACIALK